MDETAKSGPPRGLGGIGALLVKDLQQAVKPNASTYYIYIYIIYNISIYLNKE